MYYCCLLYTSWFYYENGQKATGWKVVSERWYYFNEEGIMQTGWVSVNGQWYYMDQWGAMCTGWVSVNGQWYYMDPVSYTHLRGFRGRCGRIGR